MATECALATDRWATRFQTPRGGFRLLDMTILVGATAVGCALNHWVDIDVLGVEHWQAVLWNLTAGDVGQALFLVLWLTLPTAAAWTLALIPIRLVGPRPRFRRLTCQPGL